MSLLEVITVLLPALVKLLSFCGIHLLESHATICSLGQLVELRRDCDVSSVSCFPALREFGLRRPVARWPGVLMVT